MQGSLFTTTDSLGRLQSGYASAKGQTDVAVNGHKKNWTRVDNVFATTNVEGLVIALLRAEPGAGRVGSESDRDPAWGWTWLQRGGPLRQLGFHVLYFSGLRIAWMSADVGVARWSEPVVERE